MERGGGDSGAGQRRRRRRQGRGRSVGSGSLWPRSEARKQRQGRPTGVADARQGSGGCEAADVYKVEREGEKGVVVILYFSVF